MTQKNHKNKNKELTETHEWHVKKRRAELKRFEEIEDYGHQELADETNSGTILHSEVRKEDGMED